MFNCSALFCTVLFRSTSIVSKTVWFSLRFGKDYKMSKEFTKWFCFSKRPRLTNMMLVLSPIVTRPAVCCTAAAQQQHRVCLVGGGWVASYPLSCNSQLMLRLNWGWGWVGLWQKETPYMYSCKECGNNFKWKSSLANHRRSMHMTEEDKSIEMIHCSLCNFRCQGGEKYLKMHVSRVHEVKTLSCDECGLKYTNHNTLRKHLKNKHWYKWFNK